MCPTQPDIIAVMRLTGVLSTAEHGGQEHKPFSIGFLAWFLLGL